MILRAEGWHRAGIFVVNSATVTVLVDVEVEVGMAAVTIDVIIYSRGERSVNMFQTAGWDSNTRR